MDQRAFDAAYAAHTARHGARPGALEAIEALRDLQLARAATLEAARDPAALDHLVAAASLARGLGVFATGSGEGLAAAAEALAIDGRRARLLEAFGRGDEARAVWRAIDAEPNGLGRLVPR